MLTPIMLHVRLQVGCHSNLPLAMYAVDALRQLAMKFLERDELANYTFQNDFLRPFVVVMRQSQVRAGGGLGASARWGPAPVGSRRRASTPHMSLSSAGGLFAWLLMLLMPVNPPLLLARLWRSASSSSAA